MTRSSGSHRCMNRSEGESDPAMIDVDHLASQLQLGHLCGSSARCAVGKDQAYLRTRSLPEE